MKVKINNEEFNSESVRIESNGKEYLIQDYDDGIKIVEITSEIINIIPQTANSIRLK